MVNGQKYSKMDENGQQLSKIINFCQNGQKGKSGKSGKNGQNAKYIKSTTEACR